MTQNASQTRVCKLTSLPDKSTRQVRVIGKEILLCRSGDEVFAIDDTCPHEDVSLSLGAYDGKVVRCPLHGSRFCVRSGAVLDPPAEQDLRTYAVTIKDGWIVVS